MPASVEPINKPTSAGAATATKPANAKSTAANKVKVYSATAPMALLGSFIQFVFSVFCLTKTPWGRTTDTSITSQLYDLLFTANLKDYLPAQRGVSYVGPALLATLTRPLTLIFDDKVRAFFMAKVLPRFNLSQPQVDLVQLVFQNSKLWNFWAARTLLAAVFVWSLAMLRRSLSEKFKSSALPRIFTALSLASAIPFLSASALQTQTFSMILLNLALAALVTGHYNRTISLLTVNLAIFDIFGGSVLLLSTIFVACVFLEAFRPFKAFAAFSLTLPVAIAVSLVFDSLLYNKFIWPQGELLFAVNPQAVIAGLKASLLEAVSNFSLESALKSKMTVNLGMALLPALVVYIFGRANRYTRALLSLYAMTASFNIVFMSGTIGSACTPQIVPLLVASSISVLGGIRSSSRIAKSATYLFFLGIVLPATFWSVGRLHVEIAEGQQFTGQALMTLNEKILQESTEGVPVRVFIEPEIAAHGYNRFLELTRNTLYSTASKAVRTDFYIGPQSQCPDSKAISTFSGFHKIDLKSLTTTQTPRVAVFRASATCPSNPGAPNLAGLEPADKVSKSSAVLSKHLLKGQFASLREQRDFISQHLGKFNHKKISNSIGLIVYLYGNLLEQI